MTDLAAAALLLEVENLRRLCASLRKMLDLSTRATEIALKRLEGK